jgi:hypothetical protein
MDVDLNDVATLSYIKETISNPRVVTEVQGNVVWYWISYPWIQSALPLVYKSVKIDTVYRHLKRLESLGYLSINQPLSKRTGKTFMRLGDKCQTLLFSDAKSLELSEMDKTSEANLAKYISIGEKSEAPIGNKSEPNTILVSNTEKSSFLFSPIKSSLNETMINKDSASVREEKEQEVDFFALDDDLSPDFKPSGIEPSKKPFVAPEREKTYKYPPFQPNSPANIKNLYEEHVDSGRLDVFEYEYFNFIAWRQIKSDTGERPWDPDSVEVNDWIDFLNKTCKGSVPVKKYLGVEAQRTGTYVKKKYHYVYLFNYEYLSSPNVGAQLIKPMMDTATAYCETYYDLLRKLYQKKSKEKEVRKQIKINKYLGPDYEEIERPEGREDKD